MIRLPKILVVDDEVANIKVMHALLSERHQVLMATGGQQAVALSQRELPDLILLDIEMPDMDGLETCRQLKALDETRDIPVIFVTGHTTAAFETEALSCGAVDFVSKPINPPVMRARVDTHLKLKSQADHLRRLAFIDPLTEIGNRRSLENYLDVEWRACGRAKTPLGVILVDVDSFKAYNDHYGHQAGDQTLRLVARVLRDSLRRPRDAICRYGGEEFVCVQPESDLASTHRTAEYLGQQVQSESLPHAASATAPVVTVSLGVSVEIPGAGRTANDILAAADKQLYRAKERGRNQVSSDLDEVAATRTGAR